MRVEGETERERHRQGKENVENRRGMKEAYSHPKLKRAHTNHREGKSTPGFSRLNCYREKKREQKPDN